MPSAIQRISKYGLEIHKKILTLRYLVRSYVTRPTTIKAITEIPAKTPRPMGNTWSCWPGSEKGVDVALADCSAPALAVGDPPDNRPVFPALPDGRIEEVLVECAEEDTDDIVDETVVEVVEDLDCLEIRWPSNAIHQVLTEVVLAELLEAEDELVAVVVAKNELVVSTDDNAELGRSAELLVAEALAEDTTAGSELVGGVLTAAMEVGELIPQDVGVI